MCQTINTIENRVVWLSLDDVEIEGVFRVIETIGTNEIERRLRSWEQFDRVTSEAELPGETLNELFANAGGYPAPELLATFALQIDQIVIVFSADRWRQYIKTTELCQNDESALAIKLRARLS